jgi:hypothetical protein
MNINAMKKILHTIALLPLIMMGQKEIETTAKIDFVTVYTSAAEISYEKEMQLHKGKSTIVFTDLTPYIVENSINVWVSDPDVSIVMVSERINYSKEKKNVNERALTLKDTIVRIKKDLASISVRTEVLEMEKKFTRDALEGISSKGVSLDDIIKASMFLDKKYNELVNEYQALTSKQADLNERLTRYEKDLREAVTVTVKTMSELKVTVNCNADEKVKFKFRFLTPKGGWAPVYDFKYEGPDKPLQFVFRANVFNASGAPWQDVNMKLTTADPVNGFKLPTLEKTKSLERNEDGVKFKNVEVTNAATEYSIAHEYTIPSDAKPYMIDVSSYSMQASYNYLLIPRLDPNGFLMAKIPSWNNYNLIPATTNIYSMGTYMGKTFLDTYSDNDTLSLFLGKDKNIQCTHNEKTIDHKRFFIGNFSVENSHIDISIKNLSPFNQTLEVLDQVPVLDKDDKEKMIVSGIGNSIYDKAEGLLTWKPVLKAGESLALNYSYEIKTPKEDYDYGKPKKRKYRTISCPSF